MTLDRDYTLEDVSAALGMSERWIRDRIRDGAEHIRYGRKIRFTAAQVDALRAAHVKQPVGQSVTTGGRKKRS